MVIPAIQRFLRPPTMTPEERARRAVAAKALLDDATIQEALISIEADLLAEWKAAGTPEERENIWRAVTVLDRLKSWLLTAASHDMTALKRVK